jgi:hypothetical protein
MGRRPCARFRSECTVAAAWHPQCARGGIRGSRGRHHRHAWVGIRGRHGPASLESMGRLGRGELDSYFGALAAKAVEACVQPGRD